MQPTYVSTLPETTDMVTPIANSTPVTQASQMSVLPIVPSNKREYPGKSSGDTHSDRRSYRD